MFEKFDRLLISYPTSTIIESAWDFRHRQLEVVSVRDLLLQPLTPEEYLRRPLLHRGRWLLKAKDLERRKVKQFYLASSREFYRPTGLQLALYWPDQLDTPPASYVSRRFGVSRRERIALARAISELSHSNFDGFQLRVTIEKKAQ